MAVSVVYRLKFIQIDYQETQRMKSRIFQAVGQVRIETPTIKNACKRVQSSVGQLVGSFFDGGNDVLNPFDCFLDFQVLENCGVEMKRYVIVVFLKIRFLCILSLTDDLTKCLDIRSQPYIAVPILSAQHH